MKIIELRYIPHPLALEAIKKARSEFDEMRYIFTDQKILDAIVRGDVLDNTQAYLRRFSKCPGDKAREAFDKLRELLGNEYEAAVMLNIKPRVAEEAADILRLIRRTAPDPELAQRIVEILLEVCG